MTVRKITSTYTRNEKCIIECDLTYFVHKLGGRWKLLIISKLENNKLRFSELKKEFSFITERMLTLQLRALEKDGLVKRTEDEWQAGMTLDFDRHRQLTQQLLPHFIERRQGSILNITSTYELRSINASAVAKASIVVWSKQLAGELGRHGIRVNCLQPGLIDTANTRPLFPAEERRKFAELEIPLGDFGQPQDMANMAAFLVSPRARYITGTVAIVDGGMRRYAF